MDIVLDGDGHAGQRQRGLARLAPGRIAGAGLGQRTLAVHGDEGVEIFPGGDAIQAGLGQRKAGKAALPDLGRGLGDGQVRQRRGG